LYSNELTRLCAREDYIESCRRESFKTYIFLSTTGDLPREFPEQFEYLHKKFGIVVKLGRLLVRHDLVMLFDPEDMQKVMTYLYLLLCSVCIRGLFNAI
jgi:hypothetical protein